MFNEHLYQKKKPTISKIKNAFSLNVILEIIEAANLLINYTKPNDILIFIGQSVHYISQVVKYHRKTFTVPFSGRVYEDIYSIPSMKDIDNYTILLNNIGITRKLFDNNNIILIDHSHSGESPCLFVKVLLRCLGYINKYSYNLSEYCPNKSFKFINVVSNSQYPSWIKPSSRLYINTIGYLIMPNLVAFANEGTPDNSIYKIPRSIPHYPHYKWQDLPDYSKLDDGNVCILKLVLYYKFILKFNEISKKSILSNNDKMILLYLKKIINDIVDSNDYITFSDDNNEYTTYKKLIDDIALIFYQIKNQIRIRIL